MVIVSVFVIVIAIAIVAARSYLANRATVSESGVVPVAPAGYVYLSVQELEDLQDRITSVFEFGYKSAAKGDQYTEEDGVIYILRSTGSQLVEYSYNPLTDMQPELLRTRNMPRFIGGQATNILPANDMMPQEPPEWAVNG